MVTDDRVAGGRGREPSELMQTDDRSRTFYKPDARLFYESEAIRGGWSVRQDASLKALFFRIGEFQLAEHEIKGVVRGRIHKSDSMSSISGHHMAAVTGPYHIRPASTGHL